MRGLSVAIVCRDPDIGNRLFHCVEFLGVRAVVRAPGEAVPETVVISDGPVPCDRPVLRVELPGQDQPAADDVVRWPPCVNDLTSALWRVQGRMARSGRESEPSFLGLVGESEALARIKQLMTQAAGSDAAVLISGESGTGKELVARCLHRGSVRRERAFVPVDCAAIPAELLEGELFGHDQGAITGAIAARKGRFELAHGGTLFFDEIGDLPLSIQAKVLRAIQDEAVEPVGSARPLPCDVRIVAATRQDLQSLIRQGRFREDLYYRISVFPIAVLPLRQRREDLRLLVHELLARIRRERAVGLTLADDVWPVLEAHDWPGNVRELENLLERLVIQFPNGVVGAGDLPQRLHHDAPSQACPEAIPAGSVEERDRGVVLPVNGIDLRAFLGDMERSLIEQALTDTDSVVARAADRLHIRRTTLVEKMRKYGIRREAL